MNRRHHGHMTLTLFLANCGTFTHGFYGRRKHENILQTLFQGDERTGCVTN